MEEIKITGFGGLPFDKRLLVEVFFIVLRLMVNALDISLKVYPADVTLLPFKLVLFESAVITGMALVYSF